MILPSSLITRCHLLAIPNPNTKPYPRLEKCSHNLLPQWQLLLLRHRIKMQTPQPSCKIHICSPDKHTPMALAPNFPEQIQCNDDQRSEVIGEKGLRVGFVPDGPHTGVERRDDGQRAENETYPGADNAELGAIGDFFKAVALDLPAAAEADMREADAVPHEEV